VLFYSARNEESGMCRNNSEKLNNSHEVESETVKSSLGKVSEQYETKAPTWHQITSQPQKNSRAHKSSSKSRN
jgi:hypothetical protein